MKNRFIRTIQHIFMYSLASSKILFSKMDHIQFPKGFFLEILYCCHNYLGYEITPALKKKTHYVLRIIQ